MAKQVTFVGTVRTLTGSVFETPLTIGAWLVFAAFMGVGTLAVWTPAELRKSPQRAFAVLAIFAVIVNLRMFFYDGALAALGFLGLWTLPSDVLGDSARRKLGIVAIAAWVASWGAVFNVLNPFVAPLGAVAIAVVVWDSRFAKPQLRPVSESAESDPSKELLVLDQETPPAAAA